MLRVVPQRGGAVEPGTLLGGERRRQVKKLLCNAAFSYIRFYGIDFLCSHPKSELQPAATIDIFPLLLLNYSFLAIRKLAYEAQF